MIQQAARTTAWSPRTRRSIRHLGLVDPVRSASVHRLHRGPDPRRWLRTLRELPVPRGLERRDVAGAIRVRPDTVPHEAVAEGRDHGLVPPAGPTRRTSSEQSATPRSVAAITPSRAAVKEIA